MRLCRRESAEVYQLLTSLTGEAPVSKSRESESDRRQTDDNQPIGMPILHDGGTSVRSSCLTYRQPFRNASVGNMHMLTPAASQ